MVLVEITKEEINALDRALKEVRCSISDGVMIGSFRYRLQQIINKQIEKEMKAKFSPKK